MIVRPCDVHAAIARTILCESFSGTEAKQTPRVAWTLDFVDARIRGTSTIVRLGVRVSAFMVGVLVRLRGVDLRTAESADAARALRPWLDLPLPMLAEYVRLVRSLTLVAWYDAPASVHA